MKLSIAHDIEHGRLKRCSRTSHVLQARAASSQAVVSVATVRWALGVKTRIFRQLYPKVGHRELVQVATPVI